jgi:hypothetical protein
MAGQYHRGILRALGRADAPRMTKRLAALFLWFYVMVVAWNFVAFYTGLSVLLGPVFATAVTAFVVGDPMRRIWTPRAASK